MNFAESVKQKKRIERALQDFLNDKSKIEENYDNLVNIIKDQKILEDKYELKSVLQIINNISANYQRNFNFIQKIEQILTFLKDFIQKYFTNSEKFDLFSRNKRILLFFIEEKMITIDEYIFSKLVNPKIIKMRYVEYFGPEIKQFITDEFITNYFNKNKSLKKEEFLERISNNFSEDFYEKRKIGENDNYLCEMIRMKKTKDFIDYINKNDISLQSNVEESIFETNTFLLINERKPKEIKTIKLIEYASFFASIEIIEYMKMNSIELIPSMWLYAIHSNNEEFINYLIDNKISPPMNNYERILEESIKCHHNDIAAYIISKFIKMENLLENLIENVATKYYGNLFEYCFNYHNFTFLITDVKIKYMLFYLCEYDHNTLLKLYLKENDFDINAINVIYINILNQVQFLIFLIGLYFC